MRAVMTTIEAVTEIVGKIAGWALFAMGLIVTYEVVMRYVFTSPTIWAGEVSLQIQIWVVFLGAAYVLKHRDMVTIEIILNDPRSTRRKLADSFALVVLLVLALPAIWYGFEIWLRAARAGHTTDTSLGLPRWFTDASVWLGFSLLTLQAIVEFWRIWAGGGPERPRDPLDMAH